MGLKFKALTCALHVISFIIMTVVNFLFNIFFKKKHGHVSKVVDPLLLKPAVELAKKISLRQLKSEDVMAAYIKRAKEVNVTLNAVTCDRYDEALTKARELDYTLDILSDSEREKMLAEKPLLGVPLSVKEAFFWKGMPNSSGLVNRKHVVADRNALSLERLLEGGAIPFLQTNVSELCMWFESSNYVYGCTNNAYDASRMVGGSSGGEGCIVSSGASVIGIGSDIGGSIRMPCFFNGIFGHKPTSGVVSNDGQFPSASNKVEALLATGPMCRYASDLIPMLKVMGEPAQVAALDLDSEVDLKSLKIISVADDGGSLLVSDVDPQLKDIQKQVCSFLKDEELNVVETTIPEFKHSFAMWAGRIHEGDDGPSFDQLMADNKGRVNCGLELLKWTVGFSNHTIPAILLGLGDNKHIVNMSKKNDKKAVEKLNQLKEKMETLLDDNGVLLYPSHPKVAPYHSHPVFTPFNFAYTALFNALELPVTQCPLGLSKEGLPLGLQVVTSKGNDRLSLALARKLEERFGGWVNPGSN